MGRLITLDWYWHIEPTVEADFFFFFFRCFVTPFIVISLFSCYGLFLSSEFNNSSVVLTVVMAERAGKCSVLDSWFQKYCTKRYM